LRHSPVRLHIQFVKCHPGSTRHIGPNSVTKKSGSRGNPLSKADRIASGRYEISISWTPEI
jgi:hypothetical protein